ncbi:mucin-2-like isoform X2 [Lytechinus pictus]|uniref:mucin-2-like isoform X2 n=1 Tax=Lytechinus pictus TaxID=7653 RepID=UPI0030BA051A
MIIKPSQLQFVAVILCDLFRRSASHAVQPNSEGFIMSAMYRFQCNASLQKIPMRLVALNVLFISAGAYADSCLRSEEHYCCSDGHGLNYTLPMFIPCQTIIDGGFEVQTIPKLMQVPHVTQCRRKKELGIPFGNRICRLPDCKNDPCTQGWCEETMTGYRCHSIADNEDINTTTLTSSITTIASTAAPTTNNTATTPTSTSTTTDETTTVPLPTTTRTSATTSPSSTQPTTTPSQQTSTAAPTTNNTATTPTSTSTTTDETTTVPLPTTTRTSATTSPSSTQPTTTPSQQTSTAAPTTNNTATTPTSTSTTTDETTTVPLPTTTRTSATTSPSSTQPTTTPSQQTSTAAPTTNNTATTPTSTSTTTDETTTVPLPTTTRTSATTSPSSTQPTTTPSQQICQSNPCLNGGTCIPILDTNSQQAFECECSLEFYGTLCECSTIHTPDVAGNRTYTFPNFWIPGNATSFDFMVSADNDAHIGLFPSNTTDEKYELAIGGWANTGGQILRVTTTPGGPDILYPQNSNVHDVSLSQIPDFDHYQLSFANGHIQLSHYDNGTVVMEARDHQQPLQVSYIGIWTGFGSVGYWRFPTFCPGIPAVTRSRQIIQPYIQTHDSLIQWN